LTRDITGARLAALVKLRPDKDPAEQEQGQNFFARILYCFECELQEIIS